MILTAANALLCIFPFFFWTYLAQKWSYNVILGLKMTTNTIPFQRAFDECCESNIYSVIIENPSFGDALRELHSSTLFWRKMAQTFVRVQNFHGAHVYPKFTVSGLKYSQHPYNYSTCWDFGKNNYKKVIDERKTRSIYTPLIPWWQ